MAQIKVKVSQFCSLSTSPAWQAWLFHYSTDLHQELVDHLRKSRGCKQNSDKMQSILDRIVVDPVGAEQLVTFLRANYPYMIIEETAPPVLNKVFECYAPGVVTFPHRMILVGPEVERQLQEFTHGKLGVDHVMVDGQAYVEYLEEREAALLSQIPEKNWQIRQWRAAQK